MGYTNLKIFILFNPFVPGFFFRRFSKHSSRYARSFRLPTHGRDPYSFFFFFFFFFEDPFHN